MAGDRVFYGSGKAQIEVDDGLARMIRATLQEGAPEVMKELDAEAKAIYERAHRAWPVATGRSKAALDYGTRILSPVKIEAWVMNGAGHAFYVMLGGPGDPSSRGNRTRGMARSKASDEGRAAFVELVRKPAKAAGKRIAAAIGIRVVQMVWGRNG